MCLKTLGSVLKLWDSGQFGDKKLSYHLYTRTSSQNQESEDLGDYKWWSDHFTGEDEESNPVHLLQIPPSAANRLDSAHLTPGPVVWLVSTQRCQTRTAALRTNRSRWLDPCHVLSAREVQTNRATVGLVLTFYTGSRLANRWRGLRCDRSDCFLWGLTCPKDQSSAETRQVVQSHAAQSLREWRESWRGGTVSTRIFSVLECSPFRFSILPGQSSAEATRRILHSCCRTLNYESSDVCHESRCVASAPKEPAHFSPAEARRLAFEVQRAFSVTLCLLQITYKVCWLLNYQLGWGAITTMAGSNRHTMVGRTVKTFFFFYERESCHAPSVNQFVHAQLSD